VVSEQGSVDQERPTMVNKKKKKKKKERCQKNKNMVSLDILVYEFFCVVRSIEKKKQKKIESPYFVFL
jgi:hypothetical protein